MAVYGTQEAFDAWLTDNGYTLPAGLTAAVLLARGSAYVDAVFGSRFCGYPTGGIDQPLAWPRTGVTAFGQALASTLIPKRVEHAAYNAAWIEAQKPGTLFAVIDATKQVKRQKVEGIEREFFSPIEILGEAGAGMFGPISAIIDGLLAPLLCSGLNEPAILVV